MRKSQSSKARGLPTKKGGKPKAREGSLALAMARQNRGEREYKSLGVAQRAAPNSASVDLLLQRRASACLQLDSTTRSTSQATGGVFRHNEATRAALSAQKLLRRIATQRVANLGPACDNHPTQMLYQGHLAQKWSRRDDRAYTVQDPS